MAALFNFLRPKNKTEDAEGTLPEGVSDEAVSEDMPPDEITSESGTAPDEEFEAMFGPPPVTPAAGETASEDTAAVTDGELEEWSEPLEAAAPLEPLASGTQLTLSDGAALNITDLDASAPGLNIYRAARVGSDGAVMRLREAQGAAAERLQREAAARDAAASPQVPRAHALFENEERTYLLDDWPDGAPTLETMLTQEAPLGDVLHVLTQVAAALARLHAAGYAHLGLRPQSVTLGRPAQLGDFGFCARLGETPSGPISLAGYSAPELVTPASADTRADVFSVGALLYQAVCGQAIPESGVDFSTWTPRRPAPGVPQILRRCLSAPATRFASMEELRAALARLKNRLRPAASFTVIGASTIGLEPSRTTNQDAFTHLSGALLGEDGTLNWAMACVADGMGGMAAGEVAAQVTAQTILAQAAATCAAWRATALPDAVIQARAVKEWAQAANEQVCAAMSSRSARGGCTLACVLALGNRLALAHVGDCRTYRLRGDECVPLSRDHSLVMSLVLQGEIGLDEVRSHPDRNKVTRSLGERHPLPEYFVDTLETTTGDATLELQPGDVILLCSDGLWEPVLENEMLDAVRETAPDLHSAARRLLQLAVERGAPDNATVVLLRYDEQSGADGSQPALKEAEENGADNGTAGKDDD